jgi:hypothetical protein
VAITDTELQQILLARLAGDENTHPHLSTADLIEQALGDNPIAPQIAAALRRRESAQQQARETGAGTGEDDPVVADVLERLYNEVETLRARNDSLAAALGACPSCWGENPRCVRCRGRGRPGGRQPDNALFSELVEPAVQRAGLRPASAMLHTSAAAGGNHDEPGVPHRR